MTKQVFAFAKINDQQARLRVYDELKNGKSRFGMWSQTQSMDKVFYPKHAILLRVQKGDWIVHVNMPAYGKCVAVQTTGTYQFDAGIDCHWGKDFHNHFPVDVSTIIEFDRNDPNILPSVNLAPRRRAQKVLQVRDFLQSIANLKSGQFDDMDPAERNITHLRGKVTELLPAITKQIHEMNKSKAFERFLQRIFEGMPNTISIQNGFGWKTDHGADLIVEFENPIVNVNLTTKLVVQAKSFTGKHHDTHAVDQIEIGINEYEADAGLLITTGKETEALEEYIREKSEQMGKTIDLIAGDEVARFVLRYAPDLLIGK
ncbi:MAG: restriction endonuclease [Cryomorphaceae bacterium]|nr:restriction endonuclease [Cryomorphaceae bacterium]